MQSKKAKNSAREVNRFINPTLIDNDYDKKIGKGIPKSRRDLATIIRALDVELMKADPSLPSNISPIHLKVMKSLTEIALRDNHEVKKIECKSCGEEIEIEVNNAKDEQNTVKALDSLMDRMYPKLSSITHEVNIAGQINVIGEKIATIIVKYVPAGEKRMLCMNEVVTFLEGLSNQNEQQQIEDNVDKFSVAIA